MRAAYSAVRAVRAATAARVGEYAEGSRGGMIGENMTATNAAGPGAQSQDRARADLLQQ